MRPRSLALALAVVATSAVACTAVRGDDPDARALVRLAAAARPPAGSNWPLPPSKLEHDFVHHHFKVLSHEPIGAGVTGAVKEKVRVSAHGDEFSVKWKRMPRGADGWNNAPRKEIAAYEIQKWFLDPQDYVVPTTMLRCTPLARFRAVEADAEPTLPGTRCVLGTVTAWLEDVTVPGELYDEDRFFREPSYAYHMVSFNLLAYLIDHRDGRRGNFLVAKDEDNRRVYAVDNGIAFGAWLFNYFVRNWNDIRVPALRREAVERLRRIGPAELDALGVLVEMRADAAGVLQPVEPAANLDPERGARVAPGRLQLGLTRDEIEDVAERLEELLEDVDEGEIAVY